ncbi:aldo/keto reductase [Planctomycetota bacterium]
MQYRRFGRTELAMPVISVGGMRYQTSWKRDDKIEAASVTNLEKIVAYALDKGMVHLETAYGYGTSEEELGQVLRHLDRERFVLQTKACPEKGVEVFKSDLETSLQCLHVNYLDLFAVHGINNDTMLDLWLQSGGPIEHALKLKEQGVIRHLGFSTHGPTDTIIKAIETGLFDYVNLWFSYINQSNWPAIESARQRDMGVFIISPNDKGGHLYNPSQRLTELTAPLSPMAFNDLFILSHPEIHTISCGVTRPEDFDEHVGAIAHMKELTTTVTEVRQRLDDALNAVYDSHWADTYTQGVPEWQHTPGEINIPIILWLWNLVQAFDMHAYATARYNFMGNAQSWFPGNKADKLSEVDPNDLQRILAASPHTERILDILAQAHDLLGGEAVHRLGKA